MPPLGFVQLGMLPLGVCLPAQHGNDSQSRAVTQALGAEALHTKPTSARAHELTVRRSVTVDRGTPHDEYIANASLDRIGSYATFYGTLWRYAELGPGKVEHTCWWPVPYNKSGCTQAEVHPTHLACVRKSWTSFLRTLANQSIQDDLSLLSVDW
eukprot:364266-Chlamydomonas_euryale.AAC.11